MVAMWRRWQGHLYGFGNTRDKAFSWGARSVAVRWTDRSITRLERDGSRQMQAGSGRGRSTTTRSVGQESHNAAGARGNFGWHCAAHQAVPPRVRQGSGGHQHGPDGVWGGVGERLLLCRPPHAADLHGGAQARVHRARAPRPRGTRQRRHVGAGILEWFLPIFSHSGMQNNTWGAQSTSTWIGTQMANSDVWAVAPVAALPLAVAPLAAQATAVCLELRGQRRPRSRFSTT